MQAELQAWNNGRGIDLSGWVAIEGRFSLAVGYATVFCPEFFEFEDYIFGGKDLDSIGIEVVRGFEYQEKSTPRTVEWVINHIHIADIQSLGCPDLSADKLIAIGVALKKIYEARLAFLFPQKPCTVEFCIPQDDDDLLGYQLSFWQTKHL